MADETRERRPNPRGWRPPVAPYDPYDPTDQRPAEGYPSEYNEPIAKNWRVQAGENPNYRMFINRMRMNAFPGSAPPSDLYYGRLKVLRKSRKGSGFLSGTHYASLLLCGGIIFFGTFFYRWNDGYSNVFTGPYRLQLRVRKALGFRLSKEQEEDLLHVRHRGQTDRVIDPVTVNTSDLNNSDWALERPRRSHLLEAERIRLENEERALATALRITGEAGQSTGLGQSEGVPQQQQQGGKSWYQFWKK
ncbi:hypothetical protein BZA70DRAFT_279074 [Myxozyma melibiosi]|uniref:Uncharacterized protein n=1 Tax=Myxozyma melibiosi TaxID=54550 RepID=A0ABR1F5J0_9ASCO